nr:reverse transcriptase domain-containing protein [Tanacetum cinerariifolium]
VTVVRGSLAEVDGGCGVGTKVVAARGGELCGGSSRSGEVECFWFWPESSSKKFSGGGDGGRSPEFLPISWSVDDDANKHLDKFLHVTQSIKVNGVTDDALRLYLFSHSLTHHVTAWFDRLPRNSINTFEHMAKMFLEKYFPPSMVTKLRNEITNFRQRPDESLFEAWECYKLSIDRCPNHNMFPVTQIDTFYNGLNLRHRDTINVAARGTFMKRRPEECYDLIENMTAHHNNWDTSAQRSDSSSSITSSYDTEIAALKAEMEKINKNLMRVLQVNQHVKAVTLSCETCGGPHSFNDCPASVGNSQNIYAAGAYQGQKQSQAYQAAAYQAPVYQASVHQPQIPQPQVVTTNEYINFMKVNDAILKNMQTNITSLTNLNLELKNMFGQFMKMNIASSSGSGTLPGNIITNPKEDLKGITTRRGTAYLGPLIPTSSSSVVERRTEATKDTMNPTNNGSTEDVQPLVVLTESLILTSEPVNSLIIEPVASPVNLNFNISFADTLILMPKFGLSIKSLLTNKDKLCELARTPLNAHCSAVLLKKLPEKLGDPELADRLISRPVRVAKDVFVKVGELTLCVGKEAITFNLDQTSRYSANYNDMTANRIDVIEMACEEYSQEVLGFSDMIASGNPTSYYDPIVSTTSSTLTPFENSDFLLEEVDSFLALEDDPTLIEVDQSYLDTEGDILLLEPFLNDDPSLTSPNQGNYLLEVHRELKICKAKSDKSSIDEPPEVELKDLPPHLEYAFLEGDDKLPVIIAKDLSMEEKIALITVLKSHKRAISWKLSDIKGIDPEFCTHKILVEEDFEPAVQHQRRVNPKIHDVIKQEIWNPRAIISDRGMHFCNDQFVKVMLKYSVTQCLATAYHPQNKWSGGAYKTPIGCTPYKLVYGKAGHLPIELEHKVYWSLKHAMFDLQTAGDHRKVQLNELRDQAYENSLIYKEKTKRLHDSKIKDRVFNIGDRVLLFNSRLKIFSSKLKSRWSGPFTISHVFPYGTVELSQPDGPNFKVNGHRLKDYFGENVPKMVVPDL